MERNYTLLLDYDEYGWPDQIYGSDLLDIVRLDAKRFSEYPQFGDIVIKRTANGYHLSAPDAHLTRAEWELALTLSHCDSGFRWWSIRHGKATIRISDKTVVTMRYGEAFSRVKLHDNPMNWEVQPAHKSTQNLTREVKK